MSTIRAHLQTLHTEAHFHHTAMAGHHDKVSKCFSSMSKAAGADDGEMYKDLADHHSAIAASHEKHAEFHKTASAECSKAEEDRLGKTLRPDSFSSVIPSNVPNEGFGIRAVPRPGGPDLGDLDKSAIPPVFRHLVELSDE